jgi:MATE family multidrug resistance protein
MAADVPGAATARNPAVDSGDALLPTVWFLAWPVIVSLFSEAAVGLVDMLMVGRLGADAVAGVGVGAQILGSISVVTTAVATGTVALVARHVGAGEPALARRVLGQSIVAGFVLACCAVVPVVVWTPAVVRLFGVQPQVVDVGVAFTRLVVLSIPAGAVLFTIGAGLRAAGDTRTPLAIGIIMNVINVILNWVFIFGNLGAPALGVLGSALASTIAFTTGAVMAFSLLVRGTLRLSIRRADLRPDRPTIARVMRIGAPSGIEQFAMQMGFLVYLVFASRYGTAAVASYFIGVRILALSFLPGIGFATAASALVGQNLGAGNPRGAAEAGWHASRLAVWMMSAAGLLLFVFATPIARLFVDDAAVVEDTRWFIYMLGLCQPFMAVDYALGGALRGAGDTRFPLVTLFVGLYGCRLAFAWVVTHLDLSTPWLWAALIGDYATRAALKSWRFRSGAWQRVRV